MADTLIIQPFMGGLDTCKTEKDPFKNEGARVAINRYPIVCPRRFFIMLKGI